MKTVTTNEAFTPRNFYRPHKRVVYNPLLLDHKTGEFKEPERRVKQSFVDECNINNILKQYSATGQLKHISARAAQGEYLDLPDDLDFQSSMQIVKEGERAFATLPSKVRDRFGNDPQAFLAFMADHANSEEAIKLGLATASAPLGTPPPEPKKQPQAAHEAPASLTPPEGS